MGERDTVALTLRLSIESHERLRRTSFAVRRPISELIREAIDNHHWHANGIWCDECAPTYPIPPMDGTPPGRPAERTPTSEETGDER